MHPKCRKMNLKLSSTLRVPKFFLLVPNSPGAKQSPGPQPSVLWGPTVKLGVRVEL